VFRIYEVGEPGSKVVILEDDRCNESVHIPMKHFLMFMNACEEFRYTGREVSVDLDLEV
jgi:hypothetical protein